MSTTDPQDEIFPIVNEQDEVIGKITRKKAHQNPNIIHRAIAVLIFNPNGKLLIQKRSLTKDTSPGYWSDSIGGHVGYKEDYLSVAVREIKEELGITIIPENLQTLGKIITIASWEKEMTQVYSYSFKEKLMLNPNVEEIGEVRWVNIENLKVMLKKEKWTPGSRQVLKQFVLE